MHKPVQTPSNLLDPPSNDDDDDAACDVVLDVDAPCRRVLVVGSASFIIASDGGDDIHFFDQYCISVSLCNSFYPEAESSMSNIVLISITAFRDDFR